MLNRSGNLRCKTINQLSVRAGFENRLHIFFLFNYVGFELEWQEGIKTWFVRVDESGPLVSVTLIEFYVQVVHVSNVDVGAILVYHWNIFNFF